MQYSHAGLLFSCYVRALFCCSECPHDFLALSLSHHHPHPPPLTHPPVPSPLCCHWLRVTAVLFVCFGLRFCVFLYYVYQKGDDDKASSSKKMKTKPASDKGEGSENASSLFLRAMHTMRRKKSLGCSFLCLCGPAPPRPALGKSPPPPRRPLACIETRLQGNASLYVGYIGR